MRFLSWQHLVVGVVVVGLVYLLHLAFTPAGNLDCVIALSNHKASLVNAIREEFRRGDRKNLSPPLPTIYVITPTFRRQEQIPELTRLAQTLMNVPDIHWIVAEDTNTTNTLVLDYLAFSGLPFTYILSPMPSEFKTVRMKPKGVANRNAGLEWVRSQVTKGVVYFADDDNTYDIRLFREMRYTKQVSMWPVGLVTGAGLSSPILKNSKFIGWYDGWIGGREFPVDMAGFAVSVQFLLQNPEAKMPYKPGHEEDGFLRSLQIRPQDIEFMADDCTKIYVWHTRTMKNGLSSRNILNYNNTNLQVLQESMMLKPV